MKNGRVPAYNVSTNQALKNGGFYGSNGVWNSLVKIDGRVLRGRVETLVIKKEQQQLFMHIKNYNKKKYRIPGGSYEKGVPNYIQAQNEVNEEARIKVKNIINTGRHYIKIYGSPAQWMYDIPSSLRWVGNYTEVYVGEYDGPYTGHIREEDKDEDMYKYGKFYNLSEVYPILNDTHRAIIDDIFPEIKKGEIDESMIVLGESDNNVHYYPYYTPAEMSKLGVFNEKANRYASLDDEAIDWYHEYTDSLRNPDSTNWYKELQLRYDEMIKENTAENRQAVLNLGWNPEVVVTMENVLIASEKTKARLNQTPKKNTLIDEGLIFSEKDIALNIDDFESGKSNILFITGLAGSGKTTLAETLEKQYGAEVISLDYFQHETTFYYGGFNEFKDTESYRIVEKYMKEHPEIEKSRHEFSNISLDDFSDFFLPFFGWLINELKGRKPKKYIVEGVHILLFVKYKDIKNYPLYCVNTSAIKSIVRHWRRDEWTFKEIIKHGYKDILRFKNWNDSYNRFKKSMNENVVQEQYSVVNEFTRENSDEVKAALKDLNHWISLTAKGYNESEKGIACVRYCVVEGIKSGDRSNSAFITHDNYYRHDKSRVPKMHSHDIVKLKNQLPNKVVYRLWSDTTNDVEIGLGMITDNMVSTVLKKEVASKHRCIRSIRAKDEIFVEVIFNQRVYTESEDCIDTNTNQDFISEATMYDPISGGEVKSPFTIQDFILTAKHIQSSIDKQHENGLLKSVVNRDIESDDGGFVFAQYKIDDMKEAAEIVEFINKMNTYINSSILVGQIEMPKFSVGHGILSLKDVNKFLGESSILYESVASDINVYNSSEYLREGETDELNYLFELYKDLANNTYGIVADGKIITDTSSINFAKQYKTLSVNDFEKYRAGVCWDFAKYQEYKLKKKYHNVQNYYIVLDFPPNYPTHTITVVKIKNKYYYIEVSWSKYKGIYKANNTEDILNCVAKRLIEFENAPINVRCECRAYTDNDKLVGMSPDEYMNWMDRQKKITVHPSEADESKLIRVDIVNESIASDSSIYNSSEYLEERYIKNMEDIYYNKEKFDSGEINLCFITGHSGSGKSTMGRDMSGKDVEHYELDDVVSNKMDFTMGDFKEYGNLIYSFFKGPGKKYYYTKKDVDNGTVKPVGDSYEELLIKDFINYSIQYAKSHKNTKFVIEGIWLLDFIDPSALRDYAVYIKGTSLLASTIRAANRDSKHEAELGNNRFKAWVGRAKNIKNFASCEKDLRKYQQYFSSISTNESSSDDDKEYGLPDLKKYPMPDEKHVLSAIKFFNYVSPANEEELARNIKKKMKQYNISPSRVSDKNRLKKYLAEDSDIIEELCFNDFTNTKPVLVFDLGSVLVYSNMKMIDSLYKNKLIPDEYVEDIDGIISTSYRENSRYLEYCTRAEYIKFIQDRTPEEMKKYIPIAMDVDTNTIKKYKYTDTLLKQLKDKGYKIYYLSNWSRWSRDELVKNGTFDFLKYFDGGIFSCDVGCMKPDHKIYNELFSKYQLDPKTTVFFDDRHENVKAATEVGMYGILFDSDYTLQWIIDTFTYGTLY